MGSLNHFNLPQLIEEFDLKYFVETGTAHGHGLAHALNFPFKHLYSIEYDQGLFDYCVNKFIEHDKCNNLTLIRDSSIFGLEYIFSDCELDGNTLFWLDSHYINQPLSGPIENFNLGEEHLRYPLESELKTIKQLSEGYKDVFLIDDWRIYEEGGYETGNLPSYINRPLKSGIGFVEELFGQSHNIVRDFSSEGYLVLTPK